MWPFTPRNASKTPTEVPPEDPSGLERLELRLKVVEDQSTELLEAQGDLERQHRKDHLELLDLHERVKTSLAKLNRRAREQNEPEAEPDPNQTDLQLQQSSQPRARLLSRRGRA